MTNFGVARVATDRGARVAVVVGDDVFDAAELTGDERHVTLEDVLTDWSGAEGSIRAALESGDRPAPSPRGSARLLAPVPARASIYGAGANYYGHAREMAARAGRPAPGDPRTTGQRPWHFLKAPSTVVGDGAKVAPPAAAPDTLDWEVELAAIIGREAKDVAAEHALDFVAGYTVANDLSARSLQWRTDVHEASPFRADWLAHKSFDGACPLGPWLVPASQIEDPQTLGLGLSVNGVPMQSDRTSDMIFTVAEQIAYLSSLITLRPGDVILTGTPAGVGSGRGVFLKRGDTVEAWVEHIGTLSTRIV